VTTPGTVIGTYSFMSPEQVRADRVTPESDVFSLGCVLTYAATGRAPFHASTGAAIMYRLLNEPPDLGGLPAGLLRDTLAACLAKEPGRRPLPADLLARFAASDPGLPAAGPGATQVAEAPAKRADPGRDLEPDPGPVVHGVVVPEEVAPGVLTPGAELRVEQAHNERHENVTITQEANASPHSVVIQIAGNARISDER
jgi:serine/threonine protein kinase